MRIYYANRGMRGNILSFKRAVPFSVKNRNAIRFFFFCAVQFFFGQNRSVRDSTFAAFSALFVVDAPSVTPTSPG
jgi:hypothetical protein